MKILWIPHTPTGNKLWDGCRQYHLLRHLQNNNEMHWVTWLQSKRPNDIFHWGRLESVRREVGTEHTVSLAPNFYRLFTREYPKRHHLFLNQMLFRRALHRLIGRLQPNVLIYSNSFHWTGLPPLDKDVPLVYDFVDHGPDWIEAIYMKPADAVVPVSLELAATVPDGKPVTTIVNGVDLERYTSMQRDKAKHELNLAEFTVVSLIGLTCSPKLYFVEAVAALQRKIPNLSLLIAGTGPVAGAIEEKAHALGVRNLIMTGHVPNSEVHRYFAATDVGLYPGENVPYYRRASPLKIVEYSAAGAQVVTSPVDMFAHGWPNVWTVADNAAAFEAGIEDALQYPKPADDLTKYNWATLARQFQDVLDQTILQYAQSQKKRQIQNKQDALPGLKDS